MLMIRPSQAYNNVCSSSVHNEPERKESLPDGVIYQLVIINQQARRQFVNIIMNIFGHNEPVVLRYRDKFLGENLDQS